MTKTILILAIAGAFVAGAAVFGFISDYEAEAKKHGPWPDPILKPMNWTKNQVSIYNKQLDKIDHNFAHLMEGTDFVFITSDEAEEILSELEETELLADSIRVTAIDTIEVITDGPICGDGVIEVPEQCDPPNGVTCNAMCMAIIP